MFVVEVQQQLERLTTINQELHQLRLRQVQARQQQQAFCRRHQERLQKVAKPWRAAGGAVLLSQLRASARVLQTLQDLGSVSELLDSCTLMDLGSELQTSRLLQSFSQARPHFSVSLDRERWRYRNGWWMLVKVVSPETDALSNSCSSATGR